MADLTDIDYELLSAYLDEMLSADERAALEARLRAEPELRAALDDLRVVQQAVASLPVMPAPRDFRLTQDMIASSQPAPAPLRMADPTPMPAAAPVPGTPAKVTPLPRRAPWWAVAAAAVTLLIAGGGLFLLTNRAPEPPPLMVAAAPTELASPTSDDIANAAAMPMSTLPPTPAEMLRQFEATPEAVAPMALQAVPPDAATAETLELAPMAAAESAPMDAAGDTADAPMMAFAAPADDLPSIDPQALVDALSALLRLLLQVALRN
ncbi:MAG: hypothetical protein SNJ80_06625 [Anaerolinea sp.]